LLEEPYTLFRLLSFNLSDHGPPGTGQCQRIHAKVSKSGCLILSGLADMPVAFGFLLVGILLSVYYQVVPDVHLPADNEIFAYYIVTQMPVGIRG
jgi:hypothetical protein